MFVDNVDIYIKAGNGGAGLVSFHRAKFMPFGGPDGGDGGKGGDVIFEADHDMVDLSTFKQKTRFLAGNGKAGGSQKRTGQNGKNMIIRVPVGTQVYIKNDEGDQLIADLRKDGQSVIAVRGGKGGQGNVHFATATRKAPREAQQGQEGEESSISLKLMLLIDVAIVGLQNSGKSTLLAAVSEAKPEIADYPFTTRVPVLGMVDSGKYRCVWAEIPATHEKSQHRGTPVNQLQRASLILYLADALSGSIEQDLDKLVQEVGSSDNQMADRKYILVINKIDLLNDMTEIDGVRQQMEKRDIPVFLISALEKTGLSELVSEINAMADKEKMARTDIEEEPGKHPEKIFRPKPR